MMKLKIILGVSPSCHGNRGGGGVLVCAIPRTFQHGRVHTVVRVGRRELLWVVTGIFWSREGRVLVVRKERAVTMVNKVVRATGIRSCN